MRRGRLPVGLALALGAFVICGTLSVAKLVGRAKNGVGDHMAYYSASVRVLAGEDPYLEKTHGLEYLYPPLWAFLLVPLTAAGPVAYSLLWGLALGACWLASLELIRLLLAPQDRKPLPALVVLLPSAILFRAIFNGWGRGQVSLLLNVLVLAAFVCLHRGWLARSAFCVALAGAIKGFPLCLGAMFLPAGTRRGAAWLLIFSLVLALAPGLMIGVERMTRLLVDGFLGSAQVTIQTQMLWPTKCAPVATAWRLAGLSAGRALQVVQVVWLGIAVGALLALHRSAADAERRNLWAALAVVTMLVVTPMIAEDYLTLLMFPLAAATHSALGRAPHDRVRRRLLVAVGGPALLFNFYSPAFITMDLSRKVQALGPAPLGLMVCWVGLAAAVARMDRTTTAGAGVERAGAS
jgi:hypothetical protein